VSDSPLADWTFWVFLPMPHYAKFILCITGSVTIAALFIWIAESL